MAKETPSKNVTPLGTTRRSQLFNRLNVLHYQNEPILVRLEHKDHGHAVRVKAQPQPVTDEHATATWIKDADFPALLTAYDLSSIILTGVRRTFEFLPERYWIDEGAISFVVPAIASESKSRKRPRFDCKTLNIRVSITQNALVFPGHLVDYSMAGIMVALENRDQLNFSWLNTAIPAMLTITNGLNTVYAGQVTLANRCAGLYLATPSLEPTPRYMPRQYRARRAQFVPSPDLVFRHPVTGRKHSLKVHDLGSLGFAVDEQENNAVLLPGLLIERAQISFANSLCLTCVVQVVYTKMMEDNQGTIRSGVAILHIDLQDHLKLISLIQQAQDPKSYVSNEVDPDDLFEFFFETGFLYPHKYAEIASNRAQFLNSYLKLYLHGADIGRHFVYQCAGQILGHFATLRVYRHTWMNQHHAALNSHRAGLKVVRAISEYMNDSFQLNPANINYIIGYYQDGNKFPQHYFGEYVRSINNPEHTSLDRFAFLSDASHFGCDPGELTHDWVLERATPADLKEFRGFYDKISGGLLPEALDLTPQGYRDETLAQVYSSNGLSRQRQIYALRNQKSLKALIDIQNSDLGLNLSEITNATTVYVLDTLACHREVIRHVICNLTIRYNKLHHPVMFFPRSYLAHYNIPSDKEYTLWALDVVKAAESYMSWMNKFCR
jgi:hypothetical protein